VVKEKRFSPPNQVAWHFLALADGATAGDVSLGGRNRSSESLVGERGGRGTKGFPKCAACQGLPAISRSGEENWALCCAIRLKRMGRAGTLIGNGRHPLIRRTNPWGSKVRGRGDASGTGRCPFEPSTPGLPKSGAGPTAGQARRRGRNREGPAGAGPRRLFWTGLESERNCLLAFPCGAIKKYRAA